MATKAMKKGSAEAAGYSGRYVFVGSTMRKVPAGIIACRAGDLASCVHGASRKTVFISARRSSTDDLLKAGLKLGRGARMGRLLTLEPPRPESVPSLSGLFERVIGTIAGYRWLPVEELAAVLGGKDSADRFIGGAADAESGTLALVRGDLTTLVVPFADFAPSGDGTKPDFTKLAFNDYGLTVALGEYEASADGVLYEFDPAYRKKLMKERLQGERSFRASLRRLRLQRGLKRSDFAPVAAKTIARIERGDVERPHGKTLEAIARRLGVDAGQIESF
jgi:hypothetical protein